MKHKITYTLTYTTEVGLVGDDEPEDHINDLDIPDIEGATYLDGPTILQVEKVET